MNPDQKPPLLPLQSILFSSTLLISVIGVPWYAFSHGIAWPIWLAAFVFLWSNGISITAGYHRLWAHRSYKAHPVLKVLFALFGAAATQNSILVWASGHRVHHRHVDHVDQDPYSAKRGLWFSHIGWMLRDYPSGEVDFKNAPDLLRDKVVMWQHRNYLALVLIMNFVPPILFGLLVGDLWGSILVVGFLRLVLNHHFTFFINSLAHFWGKQPYTEENTARDNTILALFTYGEGYHNYHHLFQQDYRNGIRWWHFDPTKWLIKCASWLGLAWDLTRVPDFKIQRARVAMQFERAKRRLEDKQDLIDSQRLADFLEQEYSQFRRCLAEWNQLRMDWTQQKRDMLAEHAQQLEQRWQQAAVNTRFRELEYALKMQSKRLELLTVQIAAA